MFSRFAAGVRHDGKLGEEVFAPSLGEHGKHPGLQLDGKLPELEVELFPGRFEPDAISAPVLLVRAAFHPAGGLHALDK